MGKWNDPYEFEEYIKTTAEADCQVEGCNKSHAEWCMDEIEFAKSLIRKGWRIIKGVLHCSSCAKKKLKPKKQQP